MNFSLAKSVSVTGTGFPTFRRSTNGLIFLPCTIAGTLKEIHIMTPGTSFGTAIFNVRLNGSPLFTGDGRPTIAGMVDPVASKTGLNFGVAFGNQFFLDLNSIGPTGIGVPMTLIAVIDDGIDYEV